MQLSDKSILWSMTNKRLVIDPYHETLLQPASVDLTLGDTFLIPVAPSSEYDFWELDGVAPPYQERRTNCIIVRPGEFILGTTEQRVTLAKDLAARFEGKSSIGRRGLMAHITAGFIDPGFSGQITVELCNVGPWPLSIFSGNKIGQLIFYNLDQPASAGYGHEKWGSHYQGQTGATGARS